jgi:hypothetical protein
MGTVPAPTPLPLTPATTLTPAPTDPSTTTNFATTPQGTTTVFTTTSLPSFSGQSTIGNVSTSFAPTSAAPTTTLSLLAATSNASTSTTKFLGWTNTTAVASLPPQGTDKATVNVVVNNQNNELSLTSKIVITSSVLAAAGIALGVGFQLVRWGSRLRDDVITYRKDALRGQIDLENEALILQRGSSYTNRLAYWMVTGKWGSFPNVRDENSLSQVVNEILQVNRKVKTGIEASLRQGAGSQELVIMPSAQVSSAMTQTRGAGMFDFLEVADERNTVIPPFRASNGARSYFNLDEYDGRRLGINPPSVQAKEIPLIQTKDIRIVELWCLITKAQQLAYSDQSRTDMLMQALVKYQQIISSGHIS